MRPVLWTELLNWSPGSSFPKKTTQQVSAVHSVPEMDLTWNALNQLEHVFAALFSTMHQVSPVRMAFGWDSQSSRCCKYSGEASIFLVLHLQGPSRIVFGMHLWLAEGRLCTNFFKFLHISSWFFSQNLSRVWYWYVPRFVSSSILLGSSSSRLITSESMTLVSMMLGSQHVGVTVCMKPPLSQKSSQCDRSLRPKCSSCSRRSKQGQMRHDTWTTFFEGHKNVQSLSWATRVRVMKCDCALCNSVVLFIEMIQDWNTSGDGTIMETCEI